MKIVIINGSPKGEYSNTIHYVKYVMKHRPQNEYKIVEVGRDIKKIEKEPGKFDAIVEAMTAADGIVWAFPLYHYTMPSQLMRFIELLAEKVPPSDFRDKYAAALTTSVHFFDNIAHDYVHAVSEDLGMRYVEGFSAEMLDLMKPEGRRQLLLFFDHFTGVIEARAPVEKRFEPIASRMREYIPGELKPPVRTGNKKIVLITDAGKNGSNLDRMVDVFVRSVDGNIEVVNLNDVDIAGGCLGCIRCGAENVCVYKDGLRSVYYEKMAGADAIVFAGGIKGRYLSTRFKMFFDRSFVNGHCPLVAGGQYGYIVSGPLRQLPGLREELEARAQVSDNRMTGIVTDEYDDPGQITALVQQLAADIATGMETGYHPPPTFLGVGGHMVFRDLVYRMSGIFRADDRYYKKHGLYDYPQKEYGNRLQAFALKILLSLPPIRKMFYSRAKEEPAKMYQKIVDNQ